MLTRTPPFRAPGAAAEPVPPCRRNPDGWMIDILAGYRRAAETIRDAVAGCLHCKTIAPASYTACTRLPHHMRAPRTILAGYVVGAGHQFIDPDRYITVSLHNLRPLAGEILDAMDRDNDCATRAERAAAPPAPSPPRTLQDPAALSRCQ